jgi:hypothetical protein
MDALTEFYENYFITSRRGYFETYHYYPNIIPITGLLIYAFILLVLPKLVKKEGMQINLLMKYWNLFLSLFSLTMLIGVGVPYYNLVKKHGLFTIFCDPGFVLIGETPSPLVKKFF